MTTRPCKIHCATKGSGWAGRRVLWICGSTRFRHCSSVRSRAKVPNAAATLVLPVDGISDGFPIARSGFQHDHDGRLLLRAEYRDARGLPLTTTSKTRPIQELTSRIFPHYRPG